MDYVKEQMNARNKMIDLVNKKAIEAIKSQKQFKNENIRMNQKSIKIKLVDGRSFEVILTLNSEHNVYLLKMLTFYKLLRLAYWVENEPSL